MTLVPRCGDPTCGQRRATSAVEIPAARLMPATVAMTYVEMSYQSAGSTNHPGGGGFRRCLLGKRSGKPAHELG
jgi:hypothetical protein